MTAMGVQPSPPAISPNVNQVSTNTSAPNIFLTTTNVAGKKDSQSQVQTQNSALQAASHARILRTAHSELDLRSLSTRRALSDARYTDALIQAAESIAFLRDLAELPPKLYYDLYLSVTRDLSVLSTILYDAVIAFRNRKACKNQQIHQQKTTMTKAKKLAQDPNARMWYKFVQSTQLVLPRLYLLVTIGALYIRLNIANVVFVLDDLSRMCTCVQHPLKGLFLRAYLAQTMKSLLPDTLPQDSTTLRNNSTVTTENFVLDNTRINDRVSALNSVHFLLRSFTEMNRLWVRMQHNCPQALRDSRTVERSELRVLVASNISTLARLNVVDEALYTDLILPKLADQIIACADPLAQDYLSDCMIQVFPVEFHIHTLDTFLSMVVKLQQQVNVSNIIQSLTSRIATYYKNSTSNSLKTLESISNSRSFQAFLKYLPDLRKRFSSSSSDSELLLDFISILRSLLDYVLIIHPKNLDYLDSLFQFCIASLQDHKISHQDMSPQASKDIDVAIITILSKPVKSLHQTNAALKLKNFVPLSFFLSAQSRKQICTSFLRSLIERQEPIKSMEELESLFQFILPLIEDADLDNFFEPLYAEQQYYHPFFIPPHLSGTTYTATSDMKTKPIVRAAQNPISTDWEKECEDNQRLTAKLVFFFDVEKPEVLFQMYQKWRNDLLRSSKRGCRITLPPLFHEALKLAIRLLEQEKMNKSESFKNVSSVNSLRSSSGSTSNLVLQDSNIVTSFAVFDFCAQTLSSVGLSAPVLGMKLYLEAACAVHSYTATSPFVSDFVARAIQLFEDDLPDSKTQLACLLTIISKLSDVTLGTPRETLESWCSIVIHHACRQLTCADQTIALLYASKLYWRPLDEGSPLAQSEKVLHCFELAEKAVLSSSSSHEKALLLMDIIVEAASLYQHGCQILGGKFIRRILQHLDKVLNSKEMNKKSVIAISTAMRFNSLKAHVKQYEKLFVGFDMSLH